MPPRAYHSLTHLDEVLGHFATVAAGPGWQAPLDVWLALLFHDAIYVPGRKDNEAASADLAERLLAHWPPRAPFDLSRIRRLIELTARHGHLDFPALTPDEALFVDCDMAILGASPARYAAYEAGIAEEYRPHVIGPLFRLGRRRFLSGLLAAPRVFASDFFHHRLDAPARRNLREALDAT